MTEALRFDAERHEYRLGDAVIPHVTGILSPLYDFAGIPEAVLERAGERGRRVHEATAAFDLGQLDIEALDAELVPYVLAWSQFLIESRAEIVDVERPGWHPKYRYAGTRDRRLRIARRNAIADIKATAKISRVDALQTAAYAAIDEENSGTPISTRLTVQLRPDGTYRVQTWREKTDFAVFLAQMTVHNWRNQA